MISVNIHALNIETLISGYRGIDRSITIIVGDFNTPSIDKKLTKDLQS
jgi:hypothetical protein